MSSIDLAKIGMYLLNREKRYKGFSSSTDIIQVLNELPTDKRHIRVPQDLTYTHRQQEKKQVFFLSILHDQISVESL